MTNSNVVDLPMVLHVRTVTGFGGGPEKTILNSPRFLPPLGYRSICAYLHPPQDPGIETLVARARIAEAEMIAIVDQGPFDVGVVSKLVQVCRENSVRIWHAHDDKTNVLGLIIRQRLPIKLVTTTHGWGAELGANPWKSWLHSTCSRVALRFYHQSIAVSPNLFGQLQKWGIPESKRVMIENAIDTQRFRREFSGEQARQQLDIPKDGIVLAALGRLSREKGFGPLIEAIASIRAMGQPISLLIGGSGSLHDELAAIINRLGLQSDVKLLGHLADPRLMLQAADVFVLNSLNEGLPNVVLEAMALETPVISTRLPGVEKVIRDGEHGMLVDIADQRQLVDAICELISNTKLRKYLAINARRRIEQDYDFAARMKKVAKVYDKLMGIAP